MTDSTRNQFSLRLHNFQAIVDAHLEFTQGINLICGETNSGKSAIFRAIRSTFLNPKKPSVKYLNYKADKFQVQIDYEGNDIKWDVTPKKTKYTINGEEFIKVGMTNLFKLISNHGFVLSSDGKIMNIEGEMDLPFPFGMTSSELFKLFEKSIVCTSDSTVILKSMKESENEINKDKTLQISEQNRLNAKLKAVEDLEKDIDLNKLNKYKADLKEQNFRLVQLKENFDKVKQGYIASRQLASTPKLVDIDADIANNYTKLKNDLTELEYNYKIIKALNQKYDKEFSVSIDLADYIKKVKDYKTLENNLKILKQINLQEFDTITFDYSNLIKMQEDCRKLITLYKRISTLKGEINKCIKQQSKSKQELDTFDVCPLCGQELKHDK